MLENTKAVMNQIPLPVTASKTGSNGLAGAQSPEDAFLSLFNQLVRKGAQSAGITLQQNLAVVPEAAKVVDVKPETEVTANQGCSEVLQSGQQEAVPPATATNTARTRLSV